MSNERLKMTVDAIIDGETDKAEDSFHGYLQDKMKAMLNPQSVDDKTAGDDNDKD